MRPKNTRLSIWLTAVTTLAGTSLCTAPGIAQDGLLPGVIYRPLPPTVYFLGPGTAYSSAVRAEADFIRAVGSLRVDSAIAWSIAEDAYKKHLDNAQLYVKTFFERKVLNAQYLRLTNPTREERWKKEEERTEERVKNLYYEILKRGTITDELNWLLVHVFEQRISYNSRFMEEIAAGAANGPDPDQQMGAHISHIWLTDRPTGAGLRFRADEGVALKEDWPYLLQSPDFGEVRAEFEKHRDAAVEQARKSGKVDYDHTKALNEALGNLLLRFDEKYRQELHSPDGPSPADYAQALGFLGGLRFQVQRFVKTDHRKLLYRFTGNRLSQLVDHMGAAGLYFASPTSGDEGTYQYLFLRLRERYLEAMSRNNAKAKP